MSEREPDFAEAVDDLRGAVRKEILQPFADWLTPTRFLLLFAAIWTALIAIAVVTWRLESIALGVMAWFLPRLFR